MKIKIITGVDGQELEKAVNKFIKDKGIIRIETKPVIREKTINILSTYEQIEYVKNEYIATIIYED